MTYFQSRFVLYANIPRIIEKFSNCKAVPSREYLPDDTLVIILVLCTEHRELYELHELCQSLRPCSHFMFLLNTSHDLKKRV